MKQRGFTLLELIAVLSAIGILSSVVISLIKPIDIIRCSRDTQRIKDLTSLSSAINNYLSQVKSSDLDGPYFTQRGFDESSSTIFMSVPKDKETTSSLITADGKNWYINQTFSNNLLRINGEGWLPISFLSLSPKPLSLLPVDPLNTFNKNYFYAYAFKNQAKSFEINAKFECPKYVELAKNDGGDSDLFEVGNDLNIIPPQIYGYFKKQLSFPSLNIRFPLEIPAGGIIGQTYNDQIYIVNTGTAYLKISQITQTNPNSLLRIDKNSLTLAPQNTTTLNLTCDGRSLTSATSASTTIFIWHNDPQQPNPYAIGYSCEFLAAPLIKIDKPSVILETQTNASSVSSTITITNQGSDLAYVAISNFLYKKTAASCPNYLTATLTSNTINPSSAVNLIFTLNPTSTLQDFYCLLTLSSPSGFKATFTAYAKIKSPPSAPEIEEIGIGDQTLNLFWRGPENDGGSEIKYYELYRSLPNSTETLVTTTLFNYYSDAGLTNGQTYCYRVRAVSEIGQGDFSYKRCAKPGKEPLPPSNFSASSGNKKITLSWSPPTDNGGSVVDSYFIYYRLLGENNWRYLFEFSAYPTNSYSFVHQDLTNGLTYEYQIRAQNEFGLSDPSQTSSTPRGYPLPPTKLQTSLLTNGIKLDWQPPLSNEGSNLSYYKIYRKAENSSIFSLIATTTATSYNDFSVNKDEFYDYYVTAVNSVGESKKSNIDRNCYGNECIFDPRCESPDNLSAQSLNNKIQLSWETRDPNIEEARFIIYRSTGDEYLPISEISGKTNYIDTGLINGKKYYYYVTQSGGEFCQDESLPSNYVVSFHSSTPYSSYSLRLSKPDKTNEFKIELKWDVPFFDNGATITEYYLYKATSSPTSTYTFLAATSSLTYTDYDIALSTPLYYYVRAKNQNGLGFKSNVVGSYTSACFAKLYLIDLKNKNLNDVLKVNNNQYLSVGFQYNFETSKYNAVFYQFDKLGNPTSGKIISSSDESSFNFVLKGSNYYLIGGQVKINNNYDALLAKIDSNTLTPFWSKKITGYKNDVFLDGFVDGEEVVLTGYSSSFGQGNNDLFLTILSSQGSMKFFKTLGGAKNDVGQKVIKGLDGGYLVLGYTNSFRNNYDLLLAKFDNDGNLLWQKVYDSGGNDFGLSIATKTGGYLIAGYSDFGDQDYDIFLMNIQSDGNIIGWQKRYRAYGNDYLYKLKKDYDGHYVLIGKSNSSSNKNYDGLIMKISSSTGNLIFAKTIGWLNNDSFYGFDLAENDYYYLVGNNFYYEKTGANFLTAKISSSSDEGFSYLKADEIGGKLIKKINFNRVESLFSLLDANFKYYLSNLSSSFSKINLINYDLNLRDINLLDYNALANVCSFGEAFQIVTIQNNNYAPGLNLTVRPGNNYLYLHLENFFGYLNQKFNNYLNQSKKFYKAFSNNDNYQFLIQTTLYYATDTAPYSGNSCYRYQLNNFSEEFCSATTSDYLRPTPPINFNLTNNPSWSYIRLTWNPSQYNGGKALQYYALYRATTTNDINNFMLIATTTATSYNDSLVSSSTNYCYYVTAINEIGESDKSVVRCGKKGESLPPFNLTATLTSDLGVKLDWDNLSGIDYYVIYRDEIKIATTLSTSYLDYNYVLKEKSDLKSYRVEAIKNNTLYHSASKQINIPVIKYSPRNLNYLLGNQSITFNWTSSTLLSIKGYHLYRKNFGSQYLLYATLSSSTLIFVDNNVIAGEKYCYIVKALDDNGESLPSNEVCPTALTLPQPSFSIRQTGVFGAWLVINKIENYSPQAGFGKIKEFRVFKATTTGYRLIATLTPQTLNYIDTTGMPSNRATYTLVAINDIGQNTSTPLSVGVNSYPAAFRYYKITTDNQIFEIGNNFSTTTLGGKDPGRKSRNYALYIEPFNPPYYINAVYLSSQITKSENIKDFKLVCDDRSIKLPISGRFSVDVNLICSKIFIILNWDARLKDEDIPQIQINDLSIR
jgi:prepilin-type N-terminal cleavage/methylation domain-containing protein